MSAKHLFAALGLSFILVSCGSEKSEYDRYYEQSYRDSVATAMENAPEPAPGTKTPMARKPAAEVPKQHPGAMLISGSDCRSCHSDQQKLVGPSYMDVAAKYEANDKNRSYLVSKIKEGGVGVWGQVPMPAHPDLSKEDTGKMVDYILSLNK